MSAVQAKLRRLLPVIMIGSTVVCVCGALGWFLYSAMQKPLPQAKKVVTTVNIVRPPPPPPPPEDIPEPDIEEEVEVIEQEEAMPEPDLADIPDGPLGLDADGAAGMDGFGLAARKGGADITGLGGDPYRTYKQGLVSDMAAQLTAVGVPLNRGRYEFRVKLWLDRDGRVKRAVLAESTGDPALDQLLRSSIGKVSRVAKPPPGVKFPVRILFTARS